MTVYEFPGGAPVLNRTYEVRFFVGQLTALMRTIHGPADAVERLNEELAEIYGEDNFKIVSVVELDEATVALLESESPSNEQH